LARLSLPESLTLVRPRTQPAVIYIARMTGAAMFAYLLALPLPDSDRPVLAPLTALLVVQATLFQTIHAALRRVGAVTVGVLVAVAVAASVPFSGWTLGLLIAGSLALGMVLRLKGEILEVPVSAMLIFAVDTHAAATTRVLDTLVGAAAGLAAGLLFAPLRVQPARDAIGDLTREMSELLGEMAAGLTDIPDPRRTTEWLERTRALRGEVERMDDALSSAEESLRLNPRLRNSGSNPAAGLREGVDTLERAATDMRVLARSVADSAHIDSEHSPVKEAETRAQLGLMLSDLSAAVGAYGELIQADAPRAIGTQPIPPASTERLEEHLRSAAGHRDQLAGLLRADPSQHPDDWPLRGEILAHVDRLTAELQPRRPPGRGDGTGPSRVLGRRRLGRRRIRRHSLP
jgi:uncharacterized membrane protein YgaE (UPF0421/DUF939 family)